MWISLEESTVALWVGESLWAYPMLLSLHAIGLAVVVGVFSVRDMRLLGLFRGLRPGAFLQLSKLGWGGFVVNLISGLLLFTSQAEIFVHSTPFLLKVSFVAIGMVMAAVIQSRLRDALADGSADAAANGLVKSLALVSLLCWLAAIINGRLIAYL